MASGGVGRARGDINMPGQPEVALNAKLREKLLNFTNLGGTHARRHELAHVDLQHLARVSVAHSNGSDQTMTGIVDGIRTLGERDLVRKHILRKGVKPPAGI